VLGLITPASGDQLERRVDVSVLLEKHTQLGGQMGTIMIVYGVVLILAMAVVRYRGSGPTDLAPDGGPTTLDRVAGFPGERLTAFSAQPAIAAALTALVLVGAVVSGIWIYRTGDAGARAVWHGTPATALVPGGK
jgi:hypothetical protein